MHKIIITAAAILSLAACTSTQTGAAVGAVGGGLIGASATGGNIAGTAVGAGIGAVVGAAAGDVLGRLESDPNRCVYIDRRTNERFVDVCPRG